MCNNNIISTTSPVLERSDITINPVLNTSYDGVSDTNIFDRLSGFVEPNEAITIEFTVLFNED